MDVVNWVLRLVGMDDRSSVRLKRIEQLRLFLFWDAFEGPILARIFEVTRGDSGAHFCSIGLLLVTFLLALGLDVGEGAEE